MFITITLETKDKSFDIKIDNKQIIKNGIEILKKSGKYKDTIVDFYRSKMQQSIISGYETFENAKIYSGDILKAIY